MQLTTLQSDIINEFKKYFYPTKTIKQTTNVTITHNKIIQKFSFTKKEKRNIISEHDRCQISIGLQQGKTFTIYNIIKSCNEKFHILVTAKSIQYSRVNQFEEFIKMDELTNDIIVITDVAKYPIDTNKKVILVTTFKNMKKMETIHPIDLMIFDEAYKYTVKFIDEIVETVVSNKYLFMTRQPLYGNTGLEDEVKYGKVIYRTY